MSDAERVTQIQSNWAVTRMLRMAGWPADLGAIRAWLASHRGEWDAGHAYRFAVTASGIVVGCADVAEIAKGWGELGYWFAEEA